MKDIIAREIKKVYDELSPVIESFTSRVCPECSEPCCRQRFGIYEREDILFLKTLGYEINDADHGLGPEERCQFLSNRGCTRPRWQRPYRCTWFFCAGLLEAMQADSPAGYRRVVDLLNKIKQLRMELLGLK